MVFLIHTLIYVYRLIHINISDTKRTTHNYRQTDTLFRRQRMTKTSKEADELRSILCVYWSCHLLNSLLAPWSRVLPEKLTVSQLVKEIPRILWNPKVHYQIKKCPPPAPIRNQLDSIHAPTSNFLEILLNIILPNKPGSSKWPISLRFPHQNPVYDSPFPNTLHTPPVSFFSI